MSGTGRGTGRGRGRRKPEDMPQPDKAAMEKLKQERASLANKEPPTPPTPEQTADTDMAKTTTGAGKPPPLVEDLKEAVRGGLQLETSKYGAGVPTTTLPSMNKLNPTAAVFTPSSVTPPMTTPTGTTATTSHPIYTKHSIPVTTSTSPSKLNPGSKEFVPSGFSAASSNLPNTFNGNTANGDIMHEEELGDYLDIVTIVRGFERAAPTDQMDSGSDPVLKAAAEMLLKVSYYPGSFDELGKNFQATLSSWTPSEDILTNLAEMLVHWGVTTSDLRYAACRVSYLISGMTGAEKFTQLLLKRLQAWHIKFNDKVFKTEEEKYLFANFSGFFAEVFAKFTVGGQPITILMPFIFKYVEQLLSLKQEHFIREACKILKLTGNNLVTSEQYMEEMVKISETMRGLAKDGSLSSTCISLILQVLELYGASWCSPASPVNPSPLEMQKAATQGLNTDATPFVPSDSFMPETFYGIPVTQQPVTCADDWDEFVGEDHPVDIVCDDEDDYDGLDPEIEQEMEAFIEEIEEHLMLQDFDPELQQNKD